MPQTTHLLIGLSTNAKCTDNRAPLPPLAAYIEYAESRKTKNNGGSRAYTGNQLRRLAIMRRGERPNREIADAIGGSPSYLSKLYCAMPEHLK